MKKYLLLHSLLVLATAAQAQETLYLKNGASISVQTGAVLTIKGNMTLENGVTFTNNGTVYIGNPAAPGTGHWTDHSTNPGTYGTGKIVFNGAGNQTISTPHTLARIEVNTGSLQLLGDTWAQQWYLQKGPVNTGTFTAIVTDPASSAVQADPANPVYSQSWFNGTLRRYVAPASVNNYFFPVGSATQSHIAMLNGLMSNPLTGMLYIDINHMPKPGNDAGLLVKEGHATYVTIAPEGVWNITTSHTPTGGKYNLDLYINGFSGLTDNSFAILQRPAGSTNAADWIRPTGSTLPAPGSPGLTVAHGYATRNGLTGFGQFGIGLTSSALPVTLVDFRAQRQTAILVQLNWETATEQNNRGFEVERRWQSETTFKTVGFVSSLAQGGNSTQLLRYQHADPNNYTGISYYRLKQIDLDNRSTYTLIKAVKGINESGVTVLMWPNPNKGQFSIRVDGNNKKLQGLITDMNGRLVQRVLIIDNTPVHISGLSAGTYVVSIPNAFDNGEAFREKVIVVK